MISRRDLGRMAPGLLLGSAAWGRPVSGSDRRFLFVYCTGGWDTTWVFTPKQGVDGIDTDASGELAELSGITFLDAASRPSVRSFFELHGERTVLINGFEVSSIAHDRCRQLLFTGHGDKESDDWPTALAAAGSGLITPHLVMSGPAYTARHGSRVVRVGAAGQLPALLDGKVFSAAGVSGPSSAVEDAQNAYLSSRLATLGDEALMGDYLQALEDVDALSAMSSQLDLSVEGWSGLCSGDPVGEASVILDAFELGIARCGVLQHDGWCANTWDSHSTLDMQDWHYEELFAVLLDILDDLDGRPSASGGSLSDEVVIVIMSEMGREPRLNTTYGKGHWTWTSAMLVGAGLAGGQVVGAVDDGLYGERIDLASGEVSSSGTKLDVQHLGATLLALGDVDPGEYVDAAPIEALLA